VARGFRDGRRPGFAQLAQALQYPARALEEITAPLEQAGLLVLTEEETFVPGREPAAMSVADILAAVRGDMRSEAQPTAEVLRSARAAETRSLEGHTLADLV
jgi:DNA-binding IscR family transcriptional regulator